MTDIKDTGGPVHPIVHPPVDGITCGGVEYYGLSLRDYFAAKAMQGELAAQSAETGHYENLDALALLAYRVADAMLEARK